MPAATSPPAPRRAARAAPARRRAGRGAPRRRRRAAAAPSARPPRATADGERAQALLEGRRRSEPPTSSASSSRSAPSPTPRRRARRASKVEKLGLKTYTQVAQTPAGSRIRVRVGPFASRDEAEAALAKAQGRGAARPCVLTL